MAGGILITGATGQVGGALTRLLLPSAQVHTPSSAELNLAEPASIRSAVQHYQPRWIINTAAYTAVDQAESEPALAHAINATAPGILGEEAARLGAAVLHLSTDYVFSGTDPLPYTESDPPAPQNIYGTTKLAGEQALAVSGAPYLILRTSWVYAATGNNFLLTILRLARERDQLRIVADQTGAPTAATDLATLCHSLIARLETPAAVPPVSGIYHATASGQTTWYGFATEALRQTQIREPATRFATLQPIATSGYPTPARRPASSLLDCTKLYDTFGIRLPAWNDSLTTVLKEILPQ